MKRKYSSLLLAMLLVLNVCSVAYEKVEEYGLDYSSSKI